MIAAIKPDQRADLLQLALSSRSGREAAGADTGQVASGSAGGPDVGALAQRDITGGLLVGIAAEGVGGIGSKAQSDAFCGPEGRSPAAVARKEIRRVTLDKGGRIWLPEAMAKAAGNDKEAKVGGLVDRFEVWDPHRYQTASAVDG